MVIYFLLPIISPILFKMGLPRFGWYIQTFYKFLCHQRPERSFFLFGPKFSYSLSELRDQGYNGLFLGYPFIGNKEIGYKMAFCSRDFFMYLATVTSAFFVCFSKKRIRISWWLLAILLIPMTIDGTVQLISELSYITRSGVLGTLDSPYYLSNNLIRAITGLLFGTGTGLFLFSELKAAIKLED
ncbi:MAG: DUF2085 domain-containing protein [bacterium]